MDATLTIEVVNGQVKLTGPLHDKPLCERLLTEGRRALQQYKAPMRGIEIATPEMVPALTRRR